MAAYAALAFLSLLWGASFLLIKIAARLFDPFGSALARVGVASAALLIAGSLTGGVWPGRRPGLWGKLIALSLFGQVVPFLLLGKAAQMTTSADMALMRGRRRSSSFSLHGSSGRATDGPFSPPLASRWALRASASRSGRRRRRRRSRPIPPRAVRSRFWRPSATR